MKQLTLWDSRAIRSDKTCSRCGETKPLTEFNRMSASKDERQAQCRACMAAYKRDWYATNAPEQREKCKERNRKNKPAVDARNRQYNERYPERFRATQAVKRAVARGDLARISQCWCARCGKRATEYHHPDYSKLLEVVPLCRSCHKREHSNGVLP